LIDLVVAATTSIPIFPLTAQLFINGEYIGDCEGTHQLDARGLLDAKLGKEQSLGND